MVFLTAATGKGVSSVIDVCANLYKQANHRETTGRLNAVIRAILEDRGPSSKLGSKAKIFYVSQIATSPPTIAIVVNKPELFAGTYERYLMNQLHEQLPYSEVPIKLVFSERKRLTPEQLASRSRATDTHGDDEAIED